MSTASSRLGRAGFTLIELLTVIAIIGVLAGILIPVIGSARAKARQSSDLASMRGIATASLLYVADNRTLSMTEMQSGTHMDRYLGGQGANAISWNKALQSETWRAVTGVTIDDYRSYTLNEAFWYQVRDPITNQYGRLPGVLLKDAPQRVLWCTGVPGSDGRAGGYGASANHANPIFSGVTRRSTGDYRSSPEFTGGATFRVGVVQAGGAVQILDFKKDRVSL